MQFESLNLGLDIFLLSAVVGSNFTDVKLIVPNVQTGAACTRLWALTGGSLTATPPETAAMPTGTNSTGSKVTFCIPLGRRVHLSWHAASLL